MWRFLAGGAAMLALVGSGFFLSRQMANSAVIVPDPPSAAPDAPQADMAAPRADERTKEARRFDRFDKDKNGLVGREEYLAGRRKAFQKLDTNGDGRLAFEEYAVKATDKFSKADRDHSNGLDRPEFATTRPVRKPRPRVDCPPAGHAATTAETDGEG